MSKPSIKKKAETVISDRGINAELKKVIESGYGLERLVELGLFARSEMVVKNRMLLGAMIVLFLSLAANVVQYHYTPQPVLLSELPDGRIRPLPTLDQPLLTDKEILTWAEKCVTNIYDLSYVNWQEHIQNDTGCLSDESRKNFVKSLKDVGVFDRLNVENQGVIYAVPKTAILKRGFLSPKGYYQWIVKVPYRISVDGKRRGSLEVDMQMLIKRVPISWREDMLWVENYIVSPRG